jgi:hypothetical protein
LGAPTADRAFHFDRTSKSPKPLGPELLALNQAKLRVLIALTADEISMWGQCMFGNFAERCNDLLNDGRCQDSALEFPIHPFGEHSSSITSITLFTNSICLCQRRCAHTTIRWRFRSIAPRS